MEDTLNYLLSQATGGAQLRRNREQMMQQLASGDDTMQMQALFQLCDELNMASPMGLTTMQPGQLVGPIMSCLKKEYNPDLALLAARALTYLADSLPRTLSILAERENVDTLLDPLRNMTEIELSEQCLTCLEKLSQTPEGARAIFDAQGIGALLMFIDFFTIASQRKAWSSVLRACRSVNDRSFSSIVDLLPAMQQAVTHSDTGIRESALAALTTIARNVHSNASRVERVFDGLIDTLVALTTPSEVKSDAIFTNVLALIQVGVHSSAVVTRQLIAGGAVRNLFALLDNFVGSDAPGSPMVENTSLAQARSGSVSQSTSPAMQFAEAPSESFAAAPGSASPKRTAPTSTRPSTQQVTAIAGILANAVGINRTGLLAYMDTLLGLLQTPSSRRDLLRTAATGEPAEADSGEDEESSDEDDYEDVEEEDAGGPTGARDEEQTSPESTAQRERVANAGVPLAFKKQVVNTGHHSCDGCGKNHLVAGDWYRCNQCDDCDYCGACVQKQHRRHADGQHTFTDVAVLFGAAPVVSHCMPSKPSANELEKVAMYKSEPALLVPFLDGLQTMINVATEAESAQVTLPTCSFISSLCAQVSDAQLAQCHLEESKIHDVVLAQLASHNLWANLLGVSLLSVLLDKLSTVMVPKLMREGVADGLLQLRKNLQNGQPESAAVAKPDEWSTSLTKLSGWQAALASECTLCLARFPALKDEKRAAQLNAITTHLKNGNLNDAATMLRDVLNSGTTTFELSAGTLIADLREALVRTNSIDAVMGFMVTLSSSGATSVPANAPTALHSFVRHLQSMQTRMDEQLKVETSSSPVESTISLRVTPHEEGQDKGKRKQAGSTTTTTTASSSSSTGTASKGMTASVSVDPFVTIGDLADFVEQNLANRGDAATQAGRARRHLMNRVDEEESDGVENILPDLNSTVNSAIRGKSFRDAVSPTASQPGPNAAPPSGAARAGGAPPASAPGHYWLRCGPHVLPPSMTVLQVMERFVRNKHQGRGEAAPKHLLPNAARRQAGNEEATLFYSPVPFGNAFKVVSGASRLAALDVKTPLDVRLPSAFPAPSSVAQTLKALRNPFACSARFLSTANQDVIAVLGALHDALAHWSELLRFTHPALFTQEAEPNEQVLSPNLPFSEFESHKLNHKTLRLCCNPRMAGLHSTTWPVNVELDAPFLFPASTREFLFNVAFCGTNRSLMRMQQYAAKHGSTDRVLLSQNARNQQRLTKSKKRVWRDHPLECAMDVLGSQRGAGSVMWEFQFYHEEGSGLGPTREFYALVSQALRKRALNLWLADDSSHGAQEASDELFTPLMGLYPRPIGAESGEGVALARYFTFMGRFVARALLDGHVPTLALSKVFLKLVRGDTCALSDVETLQPSVYRVLRAMTDAVAAKTTTLALGKTPCTVESLFLVFTLPGNDAVELVPGGAQKEVTTANMGDFCDKVVDCLLNRGVKYAVEAFRAGFDDLMPVSALRTLAVDELYLAIHGNEVPVTRDEFETYSKADHGFTPTCKHVQWFYDVVSSFSLEEQQKFFQFLTGSPQLPVGGLASLRPPLTIVRKVATDQSVMESEQLPSAMTCQNYLKLPAYDTKELMEQKLRQAMEEGTGAFLLT